VRRKKCGSNQERQELSKLCHYIRHIDLLTVYEQLQDGEQYWYEGAASANIPTQFRETLAVYFHSAADSVASMFHRPWSEVPSIDLAAEVGDLIENSLEKLSQCTGQPLPDPAEPKNVTIDKFVNLSRSALNVEAGDDRLEGLLICQYDFLCFLYDTKAFDEAFEMCELIAETRCKINNDWVSSYRRARASNQARDLATKKHSSSNELKAALLAEWDSSGAEYKSRADFSRVIGKRDGVIARTLDEWIAKHQKSKIS
jgi:hypothetical protein